MCKTTSAPAAQTLRVNDLLADLARSDQEREGCNDDVTNLLAVLIFDRYQSGIDHSLIDLESGMVNWYLRIPLSSLILLSSSGAVFSRDPLHRTAPMLWKT